jgi:hypothetical protein
MKYLYTIPILILLTISAYADSVYVTPSVYYSRGEYTDDTYSDSYSGYLAIGNYKQRIVLGLDRINVNNPSWNYKQTLFTGGVILDLNNFYLKLNYGNVSSSEYWAYSNNIFNIDGFYTDYYSLYLGGSYTLQKPDGININSIHQYMLRLEYLPHWRILLSAKPVYTAVSDGRNLFGTSLRINYLPFDRLLIKVHGFIGERLYFFDPDLLILYNQYEVQKYVASAELNYFITYDFSIAGGFQHTSFGSYKINYYILGFRTNFLF